MKISGMKYFTTCLVAVCTAISLLVLVAPAYAQFSSSYKFLDAIKKKKATEAEIAIGEQPTIINTQDITTGESALHIVTLRRDLTWLTYLLQKGANADSRDIRGTTPLQIAIRQGFTDGAQVLLQYKADPNQANNTGETPLIIAVHRRDLNLVQILVKAGADPYRPDSTGRSAYDYAERDGQFQMTSTFDAAKKNSPASTRSGPVYGPTF